MDLVRRQELEEYHQYRLSGDRRMDDHVLVEGVPGHKLGDVNLINRTMRKLLNLYPGYRWRVEICDEENVGMMHLINRDINAELFSNAPYGHKIKLERIYKDPNLNCVMRAAGDILERARLERGRRRQHQKITHVEGVAQQHQPILIS